MLPGEHDDLSSPGALNHFAVDVGEDEVEALELDKLLRLGPSRGGAEVDCKRKRRGLMATTTSFNLPATEATVSFTADISTPDDVVVTVVFASYSDQRHDVPPPSVRVVRSMSFN